jgi:response regulator of citrate/malate metabolism
MQGKKHCEAKCQQAQDIKIPLTGWRVVLNLLPRADECVGFSSSRKIAAECGVSAWTVRRKLCELRKAGKVEAKQARDETGKVVWVYKD